MSKLKVDVFWNLNWQQIFKYIYLVICFSQPPISIQSFLSMLGYHGTLVPWKCTNPVPPILAKNYSTLILRCNPMEVLKYLKNSFHAKSKFIHLKLPRNPMIKKYFIIFTQGKGVEVTCESIEHIWKQQLM